MATSSNTNTNRDCCVNKLTVNKLTREERIVKGFRIRASLRDAFETTCRVLGVRESEAIEEAILLWLRRFNPNQTRLNQFFVNITNIGTQVNIDKLTVLSIKAEVARFNPSSKLKTTRNNLLDLRYGRLDERRRHTLLELLPRQLREAHDLLKSARLAGLHREANILEEYIAAGTQLLEHLLSKEGVR